MTPEKKNKNTRPYYIRYAPDGWAVSVSAHPDNNHGVEVWAIDAHAALAWARAEFTRRYNDTLYGWGHY